MHWNPVPASILDDRDAHENYKQAALHAHTIVHSDYWQRTLGGSALCVLHDDGQIAFRISTNESDALLMFKHDAVIQLTAEGPKAYSTVTHKTLPDAHRSARFHFAASLAAQLKLLDANDWSIDNYIDAIYRHEEELESSAHTWIKNGNHHHLYRLKKLMIDTGPAVM